MLSLIEMGDIVSDIEYKGWLFYLSVDSGSNQPWLQVRFFADGKPQHGRKWRLSRHMTKSELVQTALKAVLSAEEHEAREQFHYQGRRVFGPHLDVDALIEVSDRYDARPESAPQG